MGSHLHTEDKEPPGFAEGLTVNAMQQSKHFQRGSATVLCSTVNFGALALPGKERHFECAAVKFRPLAD
jgi:hypothetical protein